MRWRDQDGNDHIGTPLKFQREPGQLEAKLPNLGEHTAQIVADLDLTPGQRREILERLK
jgi:crotonobetainyl-CoA:carnitine CoA-transferase CaiB-like acyl-CoA transferase